MKSMQEYIYQVRIIILYSLRKMAIYGQALVKHDVLPDYCKDIDLHIPHDFQLRDIFSLAHETESNIDFVSLKLVNFMKKQMRALEELQAPGVRTEVKYKKAIEAMKLPVLSKAKKGYRMYVNLIRHKGFSRADAIKSVKKRFGYHTEKSCKAALHKEVADVRRMHSEIFRKEFIREISDLLTGLVQQIR